jgi:hypothetical protein
MGPYIYMPSDTLRAESSYANSFTLGVGGVASTETMTPRTYSFRLYFGLVVLYLPVENERDPWRRFRDIRGQSLNFDPEYLGNAST